MNSAATVTPTATTIPSSSSTAIPQSIDVACIAANANKFHVQLRHTQTYHSADQPLVPPEPDSTEAIEGHESKVGEDGDDAAAFIRCRPSMACFASATRSAAANRRNSRSAESIPLLLLDGTPSRPRRKNSVPDAFNGELLETLQTIGKDKYSAVESPDTCDDAADTMMPPLQSQPSNVPAACSEQGSMITPKKLHNPCLESADRKNLHRELMFNQKIGKSVLNQKSELQQAMQKKKERQQLSEQLHEQQQRHEMGSELGRAIMQRAARRLEQQQQDGVGTELENEHQLNAEYMKIRAKLRATDAK